MAGSPKPIANLCARSLSLPLPAAVFALFIFILNLVVMETSEHNLSLINSGVKTFDHGCAELSITRTHHELVYYQSMLVIVCVDLNYYR